MGRARRDVFAEGLSRAEIFENARADYDAGQESRFRKRLQGVNAAGSGADYHFRNESVYYKIIERARDFDRNDMVIGQCVTRLVDNVIQDGIKYDPQTGSDELNLELGTRWEDWCDTPGKCDSEGERTLTDIAKVSLRHTVIDGDIVPVPLESGALQAFESHRIRTPFGVKNNTVLGVEMNEFRKRVRFWVTEEDISPMAQIKQGTKTRPLDVWNGDEKMLFHVYNPKRFSQTRGVSALAPIFDVAGIHSDIQFAALIAVQTQTCFAILEQRDANYTANQAPPATGALTSEIAPDGAVRTLENIGPGMRVTSAVGAKLTGFSPSIPGPIFGEHTKLVLTFMSINLGMPVSIMLLDPSETNFSGWRGAVDQARIGFMALQQMMIDRFYKPTVLWKIKDFLAEDPALAKLALSKDKNGRPVKPFSHKWNPPRWRYIEPVKDAQGAALRIEKKLDSQRDVLHETGTDLDDMMKTVIDDNGKWIELANAKADELSKKYNREIDWHEVLNLPTSVNPIQVIPDAEMELQQKQADAAAKAKQQQPARSNGASKNANN